MRTRKDIEELEDKILAPFGMKSKDSAGREYVEEAHGVRTCYQRDRDRIVHSEAFRKLEYKTQVFVIFEGDYYRTRLTHTIEVAQIARTIGRSLRLNEDLIEAIALAHDLGHPPFGHAGEFALDDIMKKAKLRFNHNLRSFEIVTREKRYPDFDGLNLSREVIIGILKHKTVYDKPGIIQKYRREGPTLEAQVVDVADSLAYLAHDIDDGLTSECIKVRDLMENNLWQKAYKMVSPKLDSTDREMLKYQVVKFLIDVQIKDLLNYSTEQLRKLNFRSVVEVKKYNKMVIGFSPLMTKERNALQELLNEKLYHHPRVERMTYKARRIINDLFKVYHENLKQLPYHIYERHKNYNKKEKYQVICNYIASMTDRFALDEHKKLFNPYQKV
jgi:dGTPase